MPAARLTGLTPCEAGERVIENSGHSEHILSRRYATRMEGMKTAKIFTHGHSQAVRLPKEFRFDVSEVYIEKSDEGVILTPKKPDAWRNVRAVCGKFKGPLDRAQPKEFESRDWPA